MFYIKLDDALAALSQESGKPVVSATVPEAQSEGEVWYKVIEG